MTSPADEGSIPAQTFAYLSEAKGIQRYVFDSGPLRDVVGASDLVAGLASAGDGEDDSQTDLIRRVCTAVAGDTNVVFARRASGSFLLHSQSKQTINDIRALWRLAMMLRCPGLELSDGNGEEALPAATPDSEIFEVAHRVARKKAYECASAIRENTAAELPPAGHPLTRFVQRTGRPAVAIARYDPREDSPDDIPVDALTASQRQHADRLQGTNDGIAKRFLAGSVDDKGNEYRFPRNLDPREKDTRKNPLFPFEGDDTRIAVVHADLSGLGKTFQAVAARGTTLRLFGLSQSIERAIRAAAVKVTSATLLRKAVVKPDRRLAVIPARPVLLGGDDITILVRADLALPFTTLLLEMIECESRKELAAHRQALGDALPLNLSACAGVAIVKRGQPFTMAHAIAEQLCKFAKEVVKKNPPEPYASAVAFHLVGTTLQESYKDHILPTEMTTREGIRLTANPYRVGARAGEAGTAAYSDLRALAAAIARAPAGRGGLRELRTLVFADKRGALREWNRWREVVHGREKGDAEDKQQLPKIDACLKRLGVADPKADVFGACTPLFDALELLDIRAVEDAAQPQPAGASA